MGRGPEEEFLPWNILYQVLNSFEIEIFCRNKELEQSEIHTRTQEGHTKKDANIRQDFNWQDYHIRSRAIRQY